MDMSNRLSSVADVSLVANQNERYRVVRTGFWWSVQIGNGEQTVGKYFTETSAMRLAAMLARAFNDGSYATMTRIKNKSTFTFKNIIMHITPVSLYPNLSNLSLKEVEYFIERYSGLQTGSWDVVDVKFTDGSGGVYFEYPSDMSQPKADSFLEYIENLLAYKNTLKPS